MDKIAFKEINNIKDACIFVTNFLEDYQLTLEDLPTFEFLDLEDDSLYGCPGRNFDCDDTNLARAIYYIVWNDLPEMKLSEIGTGKKYRGDTLNTFNTVFSMDLSRAELLSNNDQALLHDAEEFKKKCYSLGNFSVLPNIGIYNTNKKATTINLFRGNWFGWKDFYDRFLLELKLCLENSNNANCVLDELVKENAFYFNSINTIEKFIDINFLNFYDICDHKHHITELFEVNFKLWKQNEIEYIKFAKNYINISTMIIGKRSEQIYKRLKEEIVKYI